MSDFWGGKRVFVTGGHGFLGKRVVAALKARAVEAIITPTRQEADLRDPTRANTAVLNTKPDVVIHCAGVVGGLFENMKHPVSFLRDNLLMGLNILKAASFAGVERVVMVGSSCMYPEKCWHPYMASDLWDGYPAGGNGPYGVSKRVLAEAARIYSCGRMGVVTPVFPNLYGPGDDFSESGHVVSSLIAKMTKAKAEGLPELPMRGSGTAKREFMYVDDAAEALLFVAEYVRDGILNMGTGQEISIRDLAELVKVVVGYQGGFQWEMASHFDGQDRKVMDSGMARHLGWAPKMGMPEGLRRTVESYLGALVG